MSEEPDWSGSELAAELEQARRRIAELEEARRVTELTVDQSPVGVVTVGGDFRFLRVNDAFCEMLGYTAAELRGVRFPDLTHPDDVEADRLGMRRLTAGQIDRWAREKRYVRKDGGTCWADVVARCVRDDDGGLLFYLAIVVDATERHDAAVALQESEARYRSVVEASHEGIALQARDGTILAWNKAAQEVLGPSEDEVVGRSAVDREWHTVHEDGSPWPASDHPTMRVFATGEPAEDILLGLQRGDERRWINANAQPVWADGDEDVPSAAVVSFVDVTEQRHALAALEAERARAQSYLDVADVMLIALDDAGTVTLANRKACEVLGHDERDVVGRDWFDLAVPDEIREPLRELYESFIRGESRGFEHLENPILTRSGDQRLISWHNAPLRDGSGAVTGILRSGRDITVQRAAEQALCDSEERYRLLVNNAYDAVWLHEASAERPGRTVDVNDRACELLGYTRAELLALDVTAIDVPEQQLRAPEVMRRLAAEGHHVFETELVRRDGSRVPVEISASRLDLRGHALVLSMVRDITERRRAQQALRESEERYRGVVELANDGIVILDAERVLFANAAFARMSGYMEDEVAGLPFLDFLQEKDRDMVVGRVRGRLAGDREPYRYEIDLVGKHGRRFAVEVNACPISLQGRTVDLVVMRDVGERRRVMAALTELQTMRDMAERVAHVGSWRFDLASGKVSWSPETYKLYDVDEDGFDGEFRQVVESRVHPDDRALVAADVARYEHVDQPGPLEFRVEHRDGSVHVLHGEGQLERGADGTPEAVVGFIQDVTEQQEAERSVREAEQRFRSLFEESPVALWYGDISGLLAWLHDLADQGVTDLVAHVGSDPAAVADVGRLVRIVAVNRSSLEVFGAAGAQEMMEEFQQTFTPETSTALLGAVLAFAEGAQTFTTRAAFQRFDGSPRMLDIYLSVAGGDALGRDHVLASFVDVTEQVRAETEIRRLNTELEKRIVSRTEQLDAATRELEALAYSMAHDVRAPLRTIDGFSAILMEEESQHLSPESLDSLQRVRKAAQTLAGLLDDLTGLSAVSRHDLARERVDLSAVAAEVVCELQAEYATRHVDVDVEPDLTAVADPYLVRLILHELLDNAWKFTAPRRHSHVRIGAAAEDGEAQAFFVHDDGVGFDMAFATHLFGAFQRMHPPGEFDGNGIGLALVQRLVRRHGGRVWAESEVGEGATVFFTLPGDDEG